jgi:hypothetical protein
MCHFEFGESQCCSLSLCHLGRFTCPGYRARGGFQHLWQGRGWNPPLVKGLDLRPGSPWTCLGGVPKTKPAPSSFWVTSSRFRLAAEAWSRGTCLSQSCSNWVSRDNHQKGWNTITQHCTGYTDTESATVLEARDQLV